MPLRSRSRKKSGAGKPALIVVILLAVLLGAWFWQKQRSEAPPAAAEPSAVSAPSDAGIRSEPLPLPPPGSAGPAAPPMGASAHSAPAADALPAFLPPQARETLRLIAQGGPFPYRQDGGTFGNREGRLPRQPNGYYREYTVDTPGLGHRGARRIVTGGQPPREYYYTEDHYESFRRFEIGTSGAPR